jgi:hypothetical protein
MRVRLVLVAVTFTVFGASAPAAAQEPEAVIELFTSQGCSSCPAADRLLGELADDKRLIVLSLPIDYWDYLGWRDTLALHAHTERQKGYSTTRGDRQVYTPQVVIDGIAERVGSERASVERAVAQLKGQLAVPVTLRRDGGNLEVDVGGGGAKPAAVWLLMVTKSATVDIGRGENRGKTITYHNVVRSWQRLGPWTGAPAHYSVPLDRAATDGGDLAVVMVQSGSPQAPGPIHGAAKIAVR